MSRVLVTGGTGMVGRAMARGGVCGDGAVFAGRGEGDLRDLGACAALFERVRPAQVIHLAARVGGVWENTRHVGEFFRDNVLINTNVLEHARRAGVQKMVCLLSSCIYPAAAPLPLRETDLHNGEPHESNFGYAYAKRMLEVQARAYRAQFGMAVVCLIPNNLYGPHDNFDLDSGHVIPALIRKIHAAKTTGAPAVCWGDGTAIREFTLVDDLAAAIGWALREYDDPPLNVGTNEAVTIRRAAETICAALGYDASRLEWDAAKPGGQARRTTDTSRFRGLSRLRPTPFAEGIAATVRWYIENFPDVRGVK